jgi:pyrimidine operon attenuation protein / uracil phosphoribosyltransferase
MSKKIILDHQQIIRKIDRLAFQLYENYYREKQLILAGVSERGYLLTREVGKRLSEISPLGLTYIEVFIDKQNPLSTQVKTSVELSVCRNLPVVMIDDVLNSGKTLLYALRPFLSEDLKSLSTLVLIDRNHRSFPVKADFVGMSLATTLSESISVDLSPGNYSAYLEY